MHESVAAKLNSLMQDCRCLVRFDGANEAHALRVQVSAVLYFSGI